MQRCAEQQSSVFARSVEVLSSLEIHFSYLYLIFYGFPPDYPSIACAGKKLKVPVGRNFLFFSSFSGIPLQARARVKKEKEKKKKEKRKKKKEKHNLAEL